MNSQIVNENESNNVLSSLNSENELKSFLKNTSSDCDCSNCVYNRELDELAKHNLQEQQLNGIRRLKKTLTPKKLCTETISNSSSGNSSDSSMC